MEEQDRYVEIINYFKYIIKETEKTNNYLIMKTILFSIMESMAQEYSNYCPKNAEVFERFICEFSKLSYLNKVDPITTYYEMQKKFKKEEIETNLDYLEDGYNYSAIQIVDLNETKEIIEEATKKGINIDRHKYIKLIYKYRCKLVHECRAIGINFKSMEQEENINYIPLGFNTKWKLNIPYNFLKNLTLECINNYIDDCKYHKRDPYQNTKDYESWYE